MPIDSLYVIVTPCGPQDRTPARLNVTFLTPRLLSPQSDATIYIVDPFTTLGSPFLLVLSRSTQLRAGNYTLLVFPTQPVRALNVSLGVPVEDSTLERYVFRYTFFLCFFSQETDLLSGFFSSSF